MPTGNNKATLQNVGYFWYRQASERTNLFVPPHYICRNFRKKNIKKSSGSEKTEEAGNSKGLTLHPWLTRNTS